ncbi:hypothetical protein Cgig2_007242 [Carnegiea gigantea]|uniref:BHLH domain-containing protein n=1 Tax=Carnegiea gigantea TaxID=171969 RepID=A0A9Q1KXZ6_9CARY|nr:hypothetical protein Cgig2_007242 [Carnegiea gigantea]
MESLDKCKVSGHSDSSSSCTSVIGAHNLDQRNSKSGNSNDPQQQMDTNLAPRLKPDNHLLISFSNSNVGDGCAQVLANNTGKTNGLVLKPKVHVQIGHPRSNQRKAAPANNYNLFISGDHSIAERWRRQKLIQKFIALSALIPGLKKMDKASVLGETTRYMEHLQERVRILEEKAKQNVKSVVLKKSQIISMDDDEEEDNEAANSSSENYSDSFSDDCATFPEIQVKMMNKEVLLIIHCEKEQGLLGRILNEMEKLHFCLKEELSVTPRELVHKLRTLFYK